MRELHKLDQVAYVRFASVYRSFQDVGEFMRELQDLVKEGQRSRARRSARPPGSDPGSGVNDRRGLHAAGPAPRAAAVSAARAPTPPVGAVVVAGGRSSAAAITSRAGEPHAEVEALRDAGTRARAARRST